MKRIFLAENNKWDKIIPNFIYNRFDLIYGNDAELLAVQDDNSIKFVPIIISDGGADLGTWGMILSHDEIRSIERYIFSNYNAYRINFKGVMSKSILCKKSICITIF